MYLNQDIVEAFGVDEKGICRSYRNTSNPIQDITSYTQEDWINDNTKAEQSETKKDEPEIPPEAEGSVDKCENEGFAFVVRVR
jgi:hypothetical protein